MRNKKLIVIIGLMIMVGMTSLRISETNALTNPDYTKEIGVDSHWALYASLSPQDTFHIEFEVIAGGNMEIDFYLVDSYNYQRFKDDLSFSVYKIYEATTYASFTYTIPKDDTFYAIFDNPAIFIFTKTVEIIGDIDYYTAEDDDTAEDDEPPAIAGYNTIFLIGIISVISIILIKKRYK